MERPSQVVQPPKRTFLSIRSDGKELLNPVSTTDITSVELKEDTVTINYRHSAPRKLRFVSDKVAKFVRINIEGFVSELDPDTRKELINLVEDRDLRGQIDPIVYGFLTSKKWNTWTYVINVDHYRIV